MVTQNRVSRTELLTWHRLELAFQRTTDNQWHQCDYAHHDWHMNLADDVAMILRTGRLIDFTLYIMRICAPFSYMWLLMILRVCWLETNLFYSIFIIAGIPFRRSIQCSFHKTFSCESINGKPLSSHQYYSVTCYGLYFRPWSCFHSFRFCPIQSQVDQKQLWGKDFSDLVGEEWGCGYCPVWWVVIVVFSWLGCSIAKFIPNTVFPATYPMRH